MNLRLFKKTPIYTLFFLLVVVAVYFYVNHATVVVEEGIHTDSNMVFEKHEMSKNISTNQSFNSDSQVANEVEKSSEDIVWKATPEQIAEVRKWRESRGWYDTSQENQDDYKSYSRDMLEQLAYTGDLKALHLLSKEMLEPEKKVLLSKAIMYGSTYAIVAMKYVEMPAYNLTGQWPADEERKKDVINAAVYPALAKMRGEVDDNPEHEFPELEEKYSVRFTEEDRQLIQKKAEKLYADLENQREQLGLGKFDNTVPPLAQAFYKSQGLLK